MVHTPVFDDVVAPRLPGERGFGYVDVPGGELPLEEVWLHADIAGLAALADLRTTFRNDGFSPLEATYVFPLPELSSVSSLQIQTGATVIDGWLRERAEARDMYAAGLAQRDKAAIVEQEREDVVTIRVGTIAPGERVHVRLTLCTPLSYSDGAIVFRFPLVVAPRHIPGVPLPDHPVGAGTAADTNLVPDASRISPPTQSGIDARLSVSIDVAANAYTIEEIGCTLRTHSTGAAGDAAFRIEALPGQRLDRDLVLRMRTTAHRQPALSLLTSMDGDGQEGTFALTVLPPTIDQPAGSARDVVVLVDTSASMSGWRLTGARRAATQVIDSLTPADRFTVLLFADTVSAPGWPADGLVQGTERNRFQAMEHLLSDSGTRARGNPRLMPALENAAGFLTDPVRPSILVLITSGDIGNEDMIAASFTPRAAAIHVHTIGIGAAVNTGLLHRLAAAGRGEMLLVEKQEALDDLAPNIRRLLGPPFLTQLSLAGAGFQLLTNTISPSRPPDIFSGISSVITGRFRGQPNGSVMVSGTGIDGRPWASRVDAAPVNGRALTQLWARAFLADLQHKYLRCQIHEADGLERLIVTTSLRFGVLTRLTAFVAVSNAATRATSAPRQVIQSVELPADWTEPELGLSAYAVEYERILASTRDRPAGQGAPDAEPARPTARTTAKPTADYAPPTWATTGSAPLPAPMPAPPPRQPPPAAAPRSPNAAPGAFPSEMPSSQPNWAPASPPPQEAPSRRGRYIGAGAAAVAVAAGITIFGVGTSQHTSTTSAPPGQTPVTMSTSAPTRSATAVDPRTGARLVVSVTSQGAGSQVNAQVSGIPVGVHARLVVVGRDGSRHQIAEWVSTGGSSTRSVKTNLGVDEIGSLAIEDPSGQTYVSAPLQ